MALDQIGIALFGVTAIFMSQDRCLSVQRWACVFGMLGQPFWYWTAIATESWGILILCPFYTLAWARGVWSFWILPRRACA